MPRQIFDTKTSTETKGLVFEFASALASGETISSASTAAVVYSGTDPSASSLINGSTSISGTKVTQSILGGVEGVVYKIICTITTSASQTLQMIGFLAVTSGT